MNVKTFIDRPILAGVISVVILLVVVLLLIAALIAVSVIFLAVVLTGRPSSGEQAPSKELLAEQIAADAAIPGSVETTFLKLDEQGNAVFSGRIVQDGKTLFSCNEMILTDNQDTGGI